MRGALSRTGYEMSYRNPGRDNKTDILSLSELKDDLNRYLETRRNERDSDLRQTSGLTLWKNRIYHACSTLSEREASIQRILNARNSCELMMELRTCHDSNSNPLTNKPWGELGSIVAIHWNRLKRMAAAENQALDAELSQAATKKEPIECVSLKNGTLDGLIKGIVVDDTVAQLKSDLENALSSRMKTPLRLLGNAPTTAQPVLQAALRYINSEKRQDDVDALVRVLQTSRTRTQSETEIETVLLVQRLLSLLPGLDSACREAQQKRQDISSDSGINDTQKKSHEMLVLEALVVPQHVVARNSIALGEVVEAVVEKKLVSC